MMTNLETAKYKPKITISSESLKMLPRLHAYGIVIIPILGLIFAIAYATQSGVSRIAISLFLVMWMTSGIGIEVGFHRYLSHNAFQTSKPIRAILTILGAMAGQGPPIYWVATHRRHHQYSDVEGDAHSPHLHDHPWRGLWHAHLGWIFDLELTNTYLFAKDLIKDPIVAKINQYYFAWIFLGLALPTLIGGLIAGSLAGALSGFFWGGLVRIFVAQHVTYAVNSICHFYGKRSFKTADQSTNNFWLAIPTWGGSWHNNHHAFPDSAINGLEWWQIDPSGWLIEAMEKIGLVWEVRKTNPERIAAKKLI